MNANEIYLKLNKEVEKAQAAHNEAWVTYVKAHAICVKAQAALAAYIKVQEDKDKVV